MTPRELKSAYERGENITALLREASGSGQNTEAIIEIAYDLQTGSYVEAMQDPDYAAHKANYTRALAEVIHGLGGAQSLLEVGVGEATTLCGVLEALAGDVEAFGFDLSWSRVAMGRHWLATHTRKAELAMASLLHLPFADAAIDVVYTSHSIEPNGGREPEIMHELLRVARRYLVLLEPAYELAEEAARRRMEQHGYCRGLAQACKAMGGTVIEHRLFGHSANPLNPTALIVVETKPNAARTPAAWACPRFHTPLVSVGNALFSEEGQCAYPIVGGIPCLRLEHAVTACRLVDLSDCG